MISQTGSVFQEAFRVVIPELQVQITFTTCYFFFIFVFWFVYVLEVIVHVFLWYLILILRMYVSLGLTGKLGVLFIFAWVFHRI